MRTESWLPLSMSTVTKIKPSNDDLIRERQVTHLPKIANHLHPFSISVVDMVMDYYN